MEGLIDDLQSKVTLPRAFLMPGGSPASAAMDMARTTVRRAEREVVRLRDEGGLANPEILKYLNRVSDFLFILARYEDRDLPMDKLHGDD